MAIPKIENFEVIESLGRGGMASVWKARQISLDRFVAIKVMASGMASDPADVEQFREEARAAARLRHPGIVQVFDAGLDHGNYYFVMELVDGYTIGEWVRRKERLPEPDVLILAECVATALHYAWESFRMIHCDIKPDNVMVDADGTVKVTDLGLARTISSMAESAGSEEIAGTPAYMSPEQAMGESALDCRSDIYSMGAMLYHLAGGRMLFEGATDTGVLVHQVNDTAPDVMDLTPSLSLGFCALIEKMLAKRCEHRPADWKAVLGDLSRVARHRMPLNPLGPGLSTMRRGARRTERLATMRPARQLAAIRPSPPPRRRFPVAMLLTIGVMTALGVAVMSWVRAHHETIREGQARRDAVRDENEAFRRRDVDLALERAASNAFEQVRGWEAGHPERPVSAARRYRAMAELYPDASAAGTALRRADELERQWERMAGGGDRDDRMDEAEVVPEDDSDGDAHDADGA